MPAHIPLMRAGNCDDKSAELRTLRKWLVCSVCAWGFLKRALDDVPAGEEGCPRARQA
jgi:hypothetical protein